ncbi:CvpA family protein [Aerococcaceae bacterium NML171108]|nr:CvpA family protein [Aerococcaceae bacterium NML171108]
MLSIAIIIALVFGFYNGYRRGLLMQLIRLIGYIVSIVLATKFYEPLTKIVEMLVPFPSIQQDTQLAVYNESVSFVLDQAFYRVITFVLIGLIGWLLTNFISLFFSKLKYYNFFWKQANYLAGGVINLVITYGVVFLFLFILSLIPIEFIQQQFVDNPLAYWIVSQTPILSDTAIDAWLQVNPF